MAEKKNTIKEPLQVAPIWNSLLINLIRSFQSTLQLLGLYNDFQVQRSLKIIIRILRQRNTETGKILYTDTEERVYKQKLQFRKQFQDFGSSKILSQCFPEVRVKESIVLLPQSKQIKSESNGQIVRIETLDEGCKNQIESLLSIKREKMREVKRKERLEETFKEKRQIDQTKINLFMNKKGKISYQQFRKEQFDNVSQQMKGKSQGEITRALIGLYEDYLQQS